MQVKTGTDIIEVERIKDSIEKLGDKFLNRVFTENEIIYCEEKNITKYEHYAARFAAKEAIFKAISPLLDNKFSIDWTNIEILNDNQGRPYAVLSKENLKNINIDISLSHIKEYALATAVVVLENK